MKTLLACICILSLSACSAKKTAQTCQEALDKFQTVKANLVLAEAALEVCAANPTPE